MSERRIIHLVDDDDAVRDGLAFLLDVAGYKVVAYETAQAFLDGGAADEAACLITDVRMPGLSGLELATHLKARGARSAVIVITGHADVAQAIEAIKAGALDFIEKPFDDAVIIAAIEKAFNREASEGSAVEVAERLRSLSTEEHSVLDRLIAGATNGAIAGDLALDDRDVERLRAGIMDKLGAESLSDLIRMTSARFETL